MSGDTGPIPTIITPGAEHARRASALPATPTPSTPSPAPKTWQQEVDDIYQLALSQIERDNNENLQGHTIVFNPTGNSEKDWKFCLFDKNGNKRKISTPDNSELDKLHKRLIDIFSVTRPIASRQAIIPPRGPSSSTRSAPQPIQPPEEPSLACEADHTLGSAQPIPPQPQVIRNPLEDQLDAARREIDALKRQTTDLKNALRRASRDISAAEHRATGVSQQAHDDMRRMGVIHDDQIRRLVAELVNERSKNRSLLSEKADQERRIFDLERQIGLLRNEIATKERDLEEAKRELNSATYEIRVANECTRLVEDDLLAANDALQEMERQFAHITEELARYHELAQRAEEDHNNALRELQFARTELESKLKALRTAERRASTAENSVRRLNTELEDLRRELESLRQSETEANERAQRAESHADGLSAKIRRLTVSLKASEQKELVALEKAQRAEAALRAIRADADKSIGDEKEKVKEAERKAIKAEDDSARLKEELEALRRKLEALRLAHSEASEKANRELAATRNKLSSTEQKATDAAEQAQRAKDELRAIRADADRSIGAEKGKVKEAEDYSARLKEELEALRRELEALRLAYSEASERANRELSATKNQLSSTEQRATAASSRAKRAEDALARTKEEAEKSKQKVTTAENRAKEAAKALSDVNEKLLRTEQAKNNAETKALEEIRRAAAAETELSALRSQLDTLRERAESAETELRGAHSENARARDSEREAQAQEQEAKRQTARLEESLKAQKSEKDDSERRAGVAEGRAREAEIALSALRKQLEETQRELAIATQPKDLVDAQTQFERAELTDRADQTDILQLAEAQAQTTQETTNTATRSEELPEEDGLQGLVIKQHPGLRSEYQKLLRRNFSQLYTTSTLQRAEQERRLAATQRQADIALVELERSQRALQEREQELNAFRTLLEQYGLLRRGSIHDGDLANLLNIFRSWESLDQKELLTHFEPEDHARLRRNLHLLGIEKINFSKDGSSVTITFKDGALIPFPHNVDRIPKLKGKTITLQNISGSSFSQFLSANGLSLNTVYKDTVEFLRDIHNIYHDIKSKKTLSPDKIFVEIEQNNNEEINRLVAELHALKQIKEEENTQGNLARIDELSKEIQVRKALTTLVHGNNSNTKRKEIMRSITPRNILTSLIGYFDRTNIAQDPSLISEIIKLRLYQSILYDISKNALDALEPQIQEGAASAEGSAESRRGSGSSASGKGKGKAKA